MTDVCVVIVTCNHVVCAGQCVESVLSSRHTCSVEVVVVDDGSVDGTREMLETFGSLLRLIERNGGHSYSNNINTALQMSDARHFLVMNPDTVLPPNGITKLYDFVEAHPDAGACGPKLVYPGGSLQLSCRRFPNPWTVLVRRTPVRWFLSTESRGTRHLMAQWAHDELQQVDWLLGACIMFRAEALKGVGYFDEQFRLYCEDIDVCHSLWEQGWSVYYNPDIVVVHDHQAQSDKGFLSRQSFWHYQSMFRYVLKHKLAGFRRPQDKSSSARFMICR